jgi:hypothetical protein
MNLSEQDIRRIVAEEFEIVLTRVLSRPEISAPMVADMRPAVVPADNGNPFLMNDAELRYAERLVTADERPILRMRVMAARLDAKGQRSAGDRQRSKADRMEQNLQKKAA